MLQCARFRRFLFLDITLRFAPPSYSGRESHERGTVLQWR